MEGGMNPAMITAKIILCLDFPAGYYSPGGEMHRKNCPSPKPVAVNRSAGRQGDGCPGALTPGGGPGRRKHGASQVIKAFFGVFLSDELYYGYIGVT